MLLNKTLESKLYILLYTGGVFEKYRILIYMSTSQQEAVQKEFFY